MLLTTLLEIEDKDQRMEKLQALLKKIPEEHFNLIARIMQFFAKISQYENVKMTSFNLAVSFGMNLTSHKDAVKLMQETQNVNKICEILIKHADKLFPEPIEYNVTNVVAPYDTVQMRHDYFLP